MFTYGTIHHIDALIRKQWKGPKQRACFDNIWEPEAGQLWRSSNELVPLTKNLGNWAGVA